MKNSKYFLFFTSKIFKSHLLTNILSLLTIVISMTFFLAIFDMKLYIDEIVGVIRSESNINVFINDDNYKFSIDYLSKINGVKNVQLISANEAKENITKILGDTESIIDNFDENPFVDYLKIEVDSYDIDQIIGEVQKMANIDYIRDNKEILEKMLLFSKVIDNIGLFILIAVLLGTIVTVFHLVRQAMETMSDRIGTLRLLGSPEYFIMIPFYIYSFLMTIMGALLSLILSGYFLKGILKMYTSFPFMPHIDVKTVLLSNSILVLGLSILLGVGGTIIGIKTSKIS